MGTGERSIDNVAVRGQYTAGEAAGQKDRRYLKEKDVPAQLDERKPSSR